MNKQHWILFLFLTMCTTSFGQLIATFEVEQPVSTNGMAIPANLDLDNYTRLPANNIVLKKVDNGTTTAIPFQIDKRTIHWMITGEKEGQKKHVYQLVKGTSEKFDAIQARKQDGALTVQHNNNNLLRYQFETVYPPAGIDTNYKRSAFIHPLWTPHGQVLTRIQPPDHYHHYGIWNPWTHTLFENDTIDFWNIKGKTGTVRFAKFISTVDGPVYTEFKALHEHVVFKQNGDEKVALNEIQTIRVYQPAAGNDHYIVDISSEMSCATASPLLILTYRYGGLGWRATEEWDKTNCQVLTSEGKTRKDTDGSKARWCIVQGTLGNDYGGAVMLSHPANYNHPEPLRIWDENANGGRGDMFANFAPTKDKDWLLEPGKTYVLKYRLVVFNGKMNPAKAESEWQYFAKPVNIKVK
jgi:hypothetical protein